jgi:5-bromo-4-chloroindolyl phosphate hydrolysis protein
MFDHMLTSNSLKGEFHKYGLTEQDITFIKEQIDPKNNKKVELTKNTESRLS